MQGNFRDFFGHIGGQVAATEEGRRLLENQPRPQVRFQEAPPGMFSTINIVYGHPNSFTVFVPELPTGASYFTHTAESYFGPASANDKHLVAGVAINFVHEFLHRRQSTQPGVENAFNGNLDPLASMAATILVEAENHATTAQTCWRMAFSRTSPHDEMTAYFIDLLANRITSKDPAHEFMRPYATALHDRQLNPENELLAKRAVIAAFLKSPNGAQAYVGLRLSPLANVLASGHLDQQATILGPVNFRNWLSGQAQFRCLSPDTAQYDASSIIALGSSPYGNIFNGSPEIISSDTLARHFTDETGNKLMDGIMDYSTDLKAWLLNPTPQRGNGIIPSSVSALRRRGFEIG